MPPDGYKRVARMAGLYGLKTREVQAITAKLLNVKRCDAWLAQWQQEKIRPELERLRSNRAHAESAEAKGSRVVYRSDDHDGISDVFPDMEIARHLNPLLGNWDHYDTE